MVGHNLGQGDQSPPSRRNRPGHRSGPIERPTAPSSMACRTRSRIRSSSWPWAGGPRSPARGCVPWSPRQRRPHWVTRRAGPGIPGTRPAWSIRRRTGCGPGARPTPFHGLVQRPIGSALAQDLQGDPLADVALGAAVLDERLDRPTEHVDKAGGHGQSRGVDLAPAPTPPRAPTRRWCRRRWPRRR